MNLCTSTLRAIFWIYIRNNWNFKVIISKWLFCKIYTI